METVSVLPAGLNTGKSLSPGEKDRVRVPPPPHPSFFTVTVMLKGKIEKRGQDLVSIQFQLVMVSIDSISCETVKKLVLRKQQKVQFKCVSTYVSRPNGGLGIC